MRLSLFFLFILSGLLHLRAQQNIQFITEVEGIQEYKLENGLQILLIPDVSQSNVIVNIVYKVGSRHEGYGEKGMAHLLEHMLFKSTKNIDDIKKVLTEKGGIANGTTFFDRTNYYEIFPSSDENLRWSIEMEADRMINATILQSDLEKEFSIVRNELEINQNDAGFWLMEKILSSAYLWHNYGHSTIGSKEDIERVKAHRLRLFYENYYQPDNATLIIGGNFDQEKALEYIDLYFSSIPRPHRILEETYTLEPPQEGKHYVEIRRTGDIQIAGAAYHATAYADHDFAAMDALNEILTADPSGYLYKTLVDSDKATHISGIQFTLRDPGVLILFIIVPKDKDLMEICDFFNQELDRVAEMQFTENDLNRAKSKLLKNFEDTKNNTLDLVIELTEMIGAGDYRLGFLYRDAVEQLTLEDIHRVASKYLIPTNKTLGVFIPDPDAKKVQPREFLDEDIDALVENYQGREQDDDLMAFEASIQNIKANLDIGALNKGLNYAILHKPLKNRKVIATFHFPNGTVESLFGKNEVKTILAGMLKAGTSTKTKEDIQDILDQLKSEISFEFTGQTLTARINSHENHFEEVMKLLNEILTDAVFPKKEFQKALDENKIIIEAFQNDPVSIAQNQIARKSDQYPEGHIFYTSTPVERIVALEKIVISDVKDLYNSLGSNNGYGTVISGIERQEIEQIIRKTFESWTSESEYEKAFPIFFPTIYDSEKIITPGKENGAMFARMNIEINQKSPDYPALIMVDALLGSGGFITSRIPTRLREKEGISYGAGSFIDIPYDHPAATWNLYATFNPRYQLKVDEALKEELTMALEHGFDKEELDACKKSWSNQRKAFLGSDYYLSEFLINDLLHVGIPLENYEELENKVEALTLEEVNAAMWKYLDPKKIVYLYAGNFE